MDKQEKVNRFLNDKLLSSTIYDILLQTFLRPKSDTIQELAAERIAIDLLQEAWKELEKYKNKKSNEVGDKANIGL